MINRIKDRLACYCWYWSIIFWWEGLWSKDDHDEWYYDEDEWFGYTDEDEDDENETDDTELYN